MARKDFKEIKKNLDVVGIIGSRVQLQASGSGYVCCCPFHDESNPSFSLNDKGKDGWLWHCFGCGKGGDVVTFVELFDRCTTAEAIAKLTGAADNQEYRETAEEINRVFKPIESKIKKPKTVLNLEAFQPKIDALWKNEAALAWLREGRGLDDDTIKRMKVGYVPTHVYKFKHDKSDDNDQSWEPIRNQGWICIPRINKDEKIVAVKLRSIVEKAFSQVNNMDSRSLFNVNTITPLAPVFVTEGEFDTMIFEMCGFNAVSVASASDRVPTEGRIQLKMAERIFLAGDNDGGAGNEATAKLLRELKENTHLIQWPDGIKDANDFFRGTCERNKDRFYAEVSKLAEKAKNAPPEGFESVLERLRGTETMDLESDPNRLHFPKNMPYSDKMCFTPRGGIAIIFSTYTGTGKSMLKTEILLAEAKRGETIADLSPEIRDEQYLALLASQTVGPTVGGLPRTGKMDRQHFLTAADMLDKPTERGTAFRYYVGHNVIGESEDEIMEFLENTIRVLGVTRFAIDTFHKLIQTDGGHQQTAAEGSLAKRIEKLGIKYGTIFLLIMQSTAEAESIDNLKKGEHGKLRGSREVRDAACSIYLLHREQQSQKEGATPDDILTKEAGLFAKKMRFNGSAFPQTKLLLEKENSLFIELSGNGGDPGQQAPPPDDSNWQPPHEEPY